MIRIIAFIRPHRLEAVKSALTAAGAEGLSVSDVRGRGVSDEGLARGTAGAAPFPIRTRLEAVAGDELQEALVEAILRSAPTGEPGDGKIFVERVSEAIRIRTGERGEAAL